MTSTKLFRTFPEVWKESREKKNFCLTMIGRSIKGLHLQGHILRAFFFDERAELRV